MTYVNIESIRNDGCLVYYLVSVYEQNTIASSTDSPHLLFDQLTTPSVNKTSFLSIIAT